MIAARIYKTKSGGVYGFKIENHGTGIVCAAVSILALNAVNSVERFTDDEIICDCDASGGYLFFIHPALKKGLPSESASLLLNSLVLGLDGIYESYENEITIFTEVDDD